MPAAGTPAAPAPVLRRLVQVSCGWPQVGRVPDLRAHLGRRRASGCAQASVRDGMRRAAPVCLQGSALCAKGASAKSRFVHVF